jgi:hypothetical protein
MKALVVYESMYGNTRSVAETVAAGLRTGCMTDVVSVGRVTPDALADADLLIVGAPTHMRGLSRASTRRSAAAAAQKEGSGLTLDADAEGRGVRDWLETLSAARGKAAVAFDTRLSGSPLLLGRASVRIASRLRRLGFDTAAPSESFLVDKRSRLLPGELERAQEWGKRLAAGSEA